MQNYLKRSVGWIKVGSVAAIIDRLEFFPQLP
jgi:hypothetical protein